MRLLPCGDTAILVECADAAGRRALDARLRADPLPGMVEHVPAERTVLVRAGRPADLQPLADALRSLRLVPGPHPLPRGGEPEVVRIPVVYDGPDLDEVATELGIEVDEVIARHAGQVWTVEFCGFMPGFAYLCGDRGGLEVSRRATPRPSVPAGAVGLAGAYTGVYPATSPGGWQLIGHTDRMMWDDSADPPTLLGPGQTVRFVDARR